MDEFNKLISELKQKRDELRVHMNLASRELKDEWRELEEKMDELGDKVKDFADKADIKETGSGIADAVGQLGKEIKLGYERLWTALKD